MSLQPDHSRSNRWMNELAASVGDALTTDADVVSAFSRDHAQLTPSGTALALVRATHTDEVVETLRIANRHRVAVVTRGAGTGLAGGANAVDGCIVLSVAGMRRIIDIDVAQRVARVEPGVINADLASAAARHDLYYAPDPASRAISSIGGNIATNAGGACCLKYGVTGNHVAALKVVLADGTIISTGSSVRKNVAGLDLTSLVVGSEGILGVVVEATMRLLPAPSAPATVVCYFDDLDAAGAAAGELSRVSELSLIEIMDRVTLHAVEQVTRMDLDASAAAMLIIQSDGNDHDTVIATCETILKRFGGRDMFSTADATEGEMFLHARRSALPALERLGTVLLDDIAVPVGELPAVISAIQRVGHRHGLTIGTFGHAGDGNLHPTIVFDPADETSSDAAQVAFDEIVSLALAHGGTITGEHGVGRLKTRHLNQMLDDPQLALMRRIKYAFDPNGILNPGALLATP